MSKLAKKEVLFAHDFEKNLMGSYSIGEKTSAYKADFYDVPDGAKEKLDKLNEKLVQLMKPEDKNVLEFFEHLSTKVEEIGAELLMFDKTMHNKIKVSSKHGHGLEFGLEVSLKDEFLNKK